MPIAYSCPHCGKSFSVAEQYAGQTGPCAACGKPITIPGAAAGFAYKPQPTSGGGGLAIIAAVLVVLLVMCGGGAVALVIPAMRSAQQAARRAQSTNNMKQLALAMHNYHASYNAFPPAVVYDANGKPLYSGRVLLLPFLEQGNLFNAFNKDEAWDSPANQHLTSMRLQVFCDPSSPPGNGSQTDYLFVTGAGTVMEPQPGGMKIADIRDGTSNTLMMVEVKGAGVNWAQPGDLEIAGPMQLPPGNHPQGNIAAMYDGSVRFIRTDTSPQTIHALATRSGNEVVP